MKKLYVFCLFIIFSLGMFAQQLNTDGENYDFLLNYTITKKGNDYYLTGKWENPGTTEIENVKTKLKVYKKIFLKSEDGDIFAYDIKKNTLALMGAQVAPPAGVDPEFEVFIYFRKSPKK